MSYKNQQEIDWAAHAEDVARALFGEPTEKHKGGKEWRWGNKGSLSVDVGKGVFTDHEAGESGGVHSLIERERKLSGPDAVDWLRKECPDLDLQFTTRDALNKRRDEQKAERAEKDSWKAKRARQDWDNAQSLGGSLVQTYLSGREISAPEGAFLRIDVNCWHSRPDKSKPPVTHPAMIGGVTVWPLSEVVAVHRTYLCGEGEKLAVEGFPAKSMLGPVGGGAVRLSGPYEGDLGRLVLCEGIETGLSLCKASGGAVWACLSAGGIEKVVVPAVDQVGRIVIAADNDRNRTGINAAEAKAQKLRKAGYEVSIAMPPEVGQDFNDLHRAMGIDAVKHVLSGSKPCDADPLPRLLNDKNWPFYANEKGVFYKAKITNKEGEDDTETRRLSSPIYVEAKTQDGEEKEWGRLLCVVTDTGKRNRVIISAAHIAEPGKVGVFGVLSSLGAIIHQNKALRDKLLDYLIDAAPEKHMICAERIGWHEASGAFVLPEESFGGRVDAPVIYGPREGVGSNPYQVKGTLADWKKEIAEPCRGNSRLIFSLCVACAGPFMRLVDGEGGVFHFSGPSSIGKSTTLAVAGSFWGGGGLNGFRDTWRATDNALENKALAHSDTLICLDELGQADAQAAQKATYMLAQGAGKSRQNKTGGSQKLMEWRINGLSSGEIGMADKLAEGRGKFSLKDGQEARFVEIPADAGVGFGLFEELGQFDTAAALADHFKEATVVHYGAPARALLEAITDDTEQYAEWARNGVKKFREKLAISGASAAVDRVAARFALVAAAGVFAAKKGIIPFEPAEISAAVKVCFQAWLQSRGGAGSREAMEGKMRTREFVVRFGDSRFKGWEAGTIDLPADVSGYRKETKLGDEARYEYYLIPTVLKKEILEGLNFKLCVDAMIADGSIQAGDGRHDKLYRVPSIGGRTRLLLLTPLLFGDE